MHLTQSGMNIMSNAICAFPWVHMSADQQGEMIICCNTYDRTTIKNNEGKVWRLQDITDPLEYFNSNYYKKVRLDMLNEKEPDACKKCYDIEKNGGRSIRQNSLDEHDMIDLVNKTNIETGELAELTLSYVHFMWGNKCNLKCKMCDPHSSNQLIEEFRQMGFTNYEYDNISEFSIDWSYIQNKQILEKIAPYIRILNVTGGEPLVNSDFLEYCYYLSDNNFSTNINLSFHTNLTVLPKKFVDSWKKFKTVTLKASIDAIEKDYEYIRYPGKWSSIEKNLKELLTISDFLPTLGIEIHTVFSSFNAHAIPNLIRYLSNIESKNFLKFPNTLLVTYPSYADSRCIPLQVKKQIEQECIEIFLEYVDETNMRTIHNINNLKSNLKFMLSEDLSQQDFINFNLKQDAMRTIKTEEVITWTKL